MQNGGVDMDIMNSINQIAKNVTNKTSDLIETQKINNKIHKKEQEVARLQKKIGSFYYKKYLEGEMLEDEVAEWCYEIKENNTEIDKLKGDLT